MPSGDFRINVGRIAAIVGFLSALFALLGAWFLMPYRLDAMEKKHEQFEQKTETRFMVNERKAEEQREILIRIDENVKQLKSERRSP